MQQTDMHLHLDPAEESGKYTVIVKDSEGNVAEDTIIIE